jgi:hypothetical protein
VNNISFTGLPGIIITDEPAIPLVISSKNSNPPYQISIAGVKYGNGLIIGFCHDSFLSDDNFDYFDNKKFISNIINFSSKKSILISVSHGEYLNKKNTNKFINFSKNLGFKTNFLYDEIDDSILNDIGILISFSAWISFKDSEILAMKKFVNNGGILLIAGLGWSWIAYHPYKKIDDLPANQIGYEFGIMWVDGAIYESKENIQNEATIFKIFYPDTTKYILNINSALKILNGDLANYKNDLNTYLSNNKDKLDSWINCLETLYKNSKIYQKKREQIFYQINNLIKNYQYYFQKDHIFDIKRESILAWIREKMAIVLYSYALPLDDIKKNLICETLNLKEIYKDIWLKFNVLILDNNSLYKKNLIFLYDLLDSLSIELHNLKLILIGKLLGLPPKGLYLLFPNEKEYIFDLGYSFATSTDIGYAIDLWDVHIDNEYENPFPSDVPSRKDPYFSGAAAHELTHIIDLNIIYKDENLYNERMSLIKSAGSDHMNYLRSILEDGFFVKNPAEFIASIANQYFCDSWNTLDLAIKRFNNNYKEPINQFLFFVKVLSMNGNLVPFYSRLENGTKLIKKDIYIEKNEDGKIIKINDSQNWKRYIFEYYKNKVNKINIQKLESSYKIISNILRGEGEIKIDNPNPSYGSEVYIEIIPKDNYEILKVYDNSIDVTNLVKNNLYKIKFIESNHNIEVIFDYKTFKVKTNISSGGKITPSGSVNVKYGDSITFTITPDIGYKIKDVLIDGKSVGPVTSYTFENVDSDHTIEAIFELNVFKITTIVSEGGKITPSNPEVKYGDSITLEFIPDPGYEIEDVIIDGKSVGLTLNFTFTKVTENHTLEVKFRKKLIEIKLIIVPQEGGKISPDIKLVEYGKSITYQFIPNEGYEIDNVLLNGKSLGSISSYTISNITSPQILEVRFRQKKTYIKLQIGNKIMYVNDSPQEIDVPPQIVEGRTYLPIKYIVEPLGGEISWDGNEKKVTITLKDTTIELWIGKNIARVNGLYTPIDSNNPKVVPMIIQGRTMLPVRFVAENLGCDVQWDSTTKTITIIYPKI